MDIEHLQLLPVIFTVSTETAEICHMYLEDMKTAGDVLIMPVNNGGVHIRFSVPIREHMLQKS